MAMSRTSARASAVAMAPDSERAKLLASDDQGNLVHWIAVQRKTFTGWANVLLSSRMLAIESLEDDLADGLLLVHLLELLTERTLIKHKKPPKSRIQQLQTVTVALDCLDAIGIRTQGISSFEIVEGNLKIILGLMWSLVSYYQIQEGGKRSVLAGKRALLVWVKNQVKQFELPVSNFSTSFSDGRVLCALVDGLVPGELNMKKVAGEQSDARRNLERAFDIAESQLHIPRILEADDMLNGKPDDLSVMTYVSFFRMKWSKPALDRRASDAQKANLSERPERDAPMGTIRRLLDGGGAAAAAQKANAAPAKVAPVVVPPELAEEEDDDDDDEDTDVYDEADQAQQSSSSSTASQAVDKVAPHVRAAITQSAPPSSESKKDESKEVAATTATAAAPAMGDNDDDDDELNALLAEGEAEINERRKSQRQAPAVAQEPPAPAEAPAEPPEDDGAPLAPPPDDTPLAPPPDDAPLAPPPDDTPLAPPPDDAPVVPATPKMVVEMRTSSEAGSDTGTPPTKKKRPKVCERCMTRKVAAKITSNDGSATAQYLCKPCAIEVSRGKAVQETNAAAPSPLQKPASARSLSASTEQPVMLQKPASERSLAKSGEASMQKSPRKSPRARAGALASSSDPNAPDGSLKRGTSGKRVCERCSNAKASLRVTLPDNTQKLMCKDCAAEQQREVMRTQSKLKTGSNSPGPSRATIRKMPNFVAATSTSSDSGRFAMAQSSSSSSTVSGGAARGGGVSKGSRAATMMRQPKQKRVVDFGTSSLRIGKNKASAGQKSMRSKRHSVIIQVPARPSGPMAPTPDGKPSERPAAPVRRRLDRTKTQDAVHAAELVSQMEALLALEGIDPSSVDVSPLDKPAESATAANTAAAAPPPPPAAADDAGDSNARASRRKSTKMKAALATLSQMWFYNDVTREAAADMLAADDVGFFVVRPSAERNALALTYRDSDNALKDDLIVLDNNRWRWHADTAGAQTYATVDALLRDDQRLEYERAKAQRQAEIAETADDSDSDESMELTDADGDVDEPMRASKLAAAQAALGNFSFDEPLSAPLQSAPAAEKARYAAYVKWVAAQNMTLEEYAIKYRGRSKEDAARLAGEATLRGVAQKGTDVAAEEDAEEAGDVRAELDDGAREIEIELSDMATYVAIASYQSESDNELSFEKGEHVIVLGPDESGWWKAELNGQFGWVPAAFFERLEDDSAQVAADLLDEAEMAQAELQTESQMQNKADVLPTSADAGDAAPVAAAQAAAKSSDEPTLAEDGEVVYAQAIEDFMAESEGELPFRRDDYVCVLKPDDNDTSGWWKGQLPTGQFGWVPAEFLELLPAKPADWAQRVPKSKSRATVQVDTMLQGNVQEQIREMELCQARWGLVSVKFGRLWTKDASPSNVVNGGDNEGDWKQRFVVLLKKERRLLELNSWQDEPTDALATHNVGTSLSGTHAARSFALFLRTRKTAVLLAPIASDKEARIERDEWLTALASVTKSTLKTKKASGRSKKRSHTATSALLKDAVLQGKLYKKSFGWKSRWFALLSTGRLHWWNDASAATQAKKSRGSISLLGAHVGKPPNAGKHHAFYIKTPATSLLLRAKTAAQIDEWIGKVDEVIALIDK